MKIKLVEPVTLDLITDASGQALYHVRPIAQDSPKHRALIQLLQEEPCPQFLLLGQWLLNYLRNADFPCEARDTMEGPLYLMTDFTDPRPLKGLRIEDENGLLDLPDVYFLGFNTNWEDLASSGIVNIFGHEYAHLWFYLLNFDASQMRSNKFHTSTAVTDAFTAFFEGFAEHLQIVTQELTGAGSGPELWDNALGLNAWVCLRDQQLRNHAVKNNRFIYQTALPDAEDSKTYVHMHMAHITSSAFTPERLKNGSQIIASEGALASIFYFIYQSETFKNQYCSPEFYRLFGVTPAEVDPVQNLYLKLIHALAKTDMKNPRLMLGFVRSYGECFPAEREEMLKLFLELTHFTTVSHQAAELFGDLYRIGRRGVIQDFKETYLKVKSFTDQVLKGVLEGRTPLDQAMYPEIWVTGAQVIPPVPWEPENLVPYVFDLNTASEVDLLSLTNIDLEQAKAIVRYREQHEGFSSLGDFQSIYPSIDIHTD